MIGESVYEDDFRREFVPLDGAVALDLDERFTGWNWEFLQSVAIKSAEVWGCWMGWLYIEFYLTACKIYGKYGLSFIFEPLSWNSTEGLCFDFQNPISWTRGGILFFC